MSAKYCPIAYRIPAFPIKQAERYFSQDRSIGRVTDRFKRHPNDHVNIISFHGLKKARRVLEMIGSLYMHYHDLQPKDLVTHIDILFYVESLLYMIDDNNEGSNSSTKLLKFDFSDLFVISENEFLDNINRNHQLSTLYTFLNDHNLFDSYIDHQLRDGLLYYKLEQWCLYCISDASLKYLLNEHTIQKCNSLRSFDFRILNLLLYQLNRAKYDEDILDFFYIREILGEIVDDIPSYQDDILKNAFNSYRMYIQLYGEAKSAQTKFQEYLLDIQHQYCKLYNEFNSKYPQWMKLQRESDTVELIYKESNPGVFKITPTYEIQDPVFDEDSFKRLHASELIERITKNKEPDASDKRLSGKTRVNSFTSSQSASRKIYTS